MGRLAQLPFHAARYRDGEQSLTWLDKWSETWTPNMSTFDAVLETLRRRERTERMGGGSAVVVADTRPESQPLQHAEAEAQWLLASLAEHGGVEGAYVGESATRKAVLRRLPRARLIHPACHGHFDREDPLASGVALAAGESLQLRDMLTGNAAPAQANLVVLSACETSVHEERVIPDEFEGLPALWAVFGR